jgi:hypothetical protein
MTQSGQQWGSGGNAKVYNTGGQTGPNFIRLTDAAAWIAQVISVQPSETLSLEAMVRSSNTAAIHTVRLQVKWLDAAQQQISMVEAANLTGYQASWVVLAGTLTAPSNAALATVWVYVDDSETSGGYWDVDSVKVFAVAALRAGTQRNSMAPVSLGGGGGGQTALVASSTADNSRAELGKNGIYYVTPSGYLLWIIANDSLLSVQLTDGTRFVALVVVPGNTPTVSTGDGTNTTTVSPLEVKVHNGSVMSKMTATQLWVNNTQRF